jgi:transposase-like protein
MDLAHGTGRKLVLAYCLRELGLMTLAEGRDADGVRRVAAAVHLSDAISAPMSPRHQKECDAALEAARARLGDAAYQAAWAAGSALAAPVLVEELRAEAAAGPDTAEPRASAPEADNPRCPHCGAAGVLLRHGRAPNGKQRYRCAACGKGTRENPGSAAYDAASRERILAARRDGASLRELTRRFGVSKNTVMAWLRDEPPSP